MWQNKWLKSFFPKRFLWQLTVVNVLVIALFVIFSSFAIYNTACLLVDGMSDMNNQRQTQFNQTLFQYLWIFSITAIVIGSAVHFYVTKKMIYPLRALIQSTKRMKQGRYPEPIGIKSKDETGQLIDHFNDLVAQLKENQHYKQKMVSDLSHELRTPLSNLNGYLSALKNGVMEGDTTLYESLYEESIRLTNMVQQLEQLKEWDYLSKSTFTEKVQLNIGKLVNQTVEMFHWSLHQHKIPIKKRIEDAFLFANDDGITQVISNLMENAIRYYQGSDPLTITGELLEKNYQISISGNGTYISIEDQDKIFDRFYRVEASRSRKTGGTGLGLSISKEIVQYHHGQIGLDSDGYHHTFWFTLPISSKEDIK